MLIENCNGKILNLILKQKISKKMSCNICLKKEEVKKLKCDRFFCEKCLSSKEVRFRSKCLVCDLIHPVREFSFSSSNQSDNLDEELKTVIDSLGIELNSIEFKLKEGDYVIKEHFNELRRQVQLAKEVHMQKVEETTNALINKITNYEKESLENFLKLDKKSYELIINQTKQMVQQSTHQIKTTENMIQKLDKSLLELNNQNEKLKYSLFDKNQLVKFVPCDVEVKETFLGCLKINEYETVNFNDAISKNLGSIIQAAELILWTDSDLFSGRNEFMHEKIDFIDDKVLLIYAFDNFTEDNNDYSYGYYFVLVGVSEGFKKIKLLCRFDGVKKTLKFETREVNFVRRNGKICFGYADFEENFLSIYDIELARLYHCKYSLSGKILGADDNYIFVKFIQKNTNKILLHFLNWKLECMHKIIPQDSNIHESFYFSKATTRLLFLKKNKKSLYLIDDENSVLLFDQSNGKLVRKINLQSKCKRLDMDENSNIVIFYPAAIYVLNSEGYFLRKIKLLNIPKHRKTYFHYWNKCVSCFDLKTLELASIKEV